MDSKEDRIISYYIIFISFFMVFARILHLIQKTIADVHFNFIIFFAV